jgi:hypothetical protein
MLKVQIQGIKSELVENVTIVPTPNDMQFWGEVHVKLSTSYYNDVFFLRSEYNCDLHNMWGHKVGMLWGR